MYFIEFFVAVVILIGLALYGLFLVSPLVSLVAALLLAGWLFKIEARGGLAIFSAAYTVPLLITFGVRLAL